MKPGTSEYKRLHEWVYRIKGRPDVCQECGATSKSRKLQWANKSHEYLREADDFVSLCVPCHRKLDKATHFEANKTHCDSGHAFDSENTYMLKGGRYCRQCGTDRSKRYYARKKGLVA